MRTQINHGIGAESLRPHSGHHFVSAGKTFLQLGQDIVFFLLLEACNTGIACGRMGCPQWGHAPACDEILLLQAGQSISWILMVSLLLFYFSVLPDADKNGKSYATFRKSEQKKEVPRFTLAWGTAKSHNCGCKGDTSTQTRTALQRQSTIAKISGFQANWLLKVKI